MCPGIQIIWNMIWYWITTVDTGYTKKFFGLRAPPVSQSSKPNQAVQNIYFNWNSLFTYVTTQHSNGQLQKQN